MFEQVVDYMRSSNGSDFLRNLGTMVRDNPVPVALVGTGLVWLMLSSSRSTGGKDTMTRTIARIVWRESLRRRAEYEDGGSRRQEGGGRKRPRVRHGESAASGCTLECPVQRYATGLDARGARARHRVSGTGEQLWQGAREAGDRASYYGGRVRRGFFDTLHEQPLVLGALGLAAGAAIGAALPETEREDEWLGDSRDRLKERAKEAGWEQVEKARAAAGAAYSAAREEAERQGLTLEGGKAAAESAAEAVCAESGAGRGGGDRGRQD